jgi:hypothetical protein
MTIFFPRKGNLSRMEQKLFAHYEAEVLQLSSWLITHGDLYWSCGKIAVAAVTVSCPRTTQINCSLYGNQVSWHCFATSVS